MKDRAISMTPTAGSLPPSAPSVPPPSPSQEGAARLLKYVYALGAIILGFIAVCWAMPRHAIPENAGFFASTALMLAGFAVAGWVRRRLKVNLPVRTRVVILVAIAKLLVGLWWWDTYFYDTATQYPRPDFVASEGYGERTSDVECILEIVRIWDKSGIHYISESEAYVPINNRPPAHLAALVIRAFGMRYHAYFPFVALLMGLASLAMIGALVGSGLSGRTLEFAAWLVLLWPIELIVGNVTKDPILVAFVALFAAVLVLSQRAGRGSGWAIVGSFFVLPPFRPVYAIACAIAGAVALKRGRAKLHVKVLLAFALVACVIAAQYMLGVQESVESHTQESRTIWPVLNVPILGRLLFAFVTPFPWTNAFANGVDLASLYTSFLHMQQIVTLGMLFALAHAFLRRGRLPFPDDGAVLGVGMMALGIAAPYINAQYVHVGAITLLPYASRMAPRPMVRYLAAALAVFLIGNMSWILTGRWGQSRSEDTLSIDPGGPAAPGAEERRFASSAASSLAARRQIDHFVEHPLVWLDRVPP